MKTELRDCVSLQSTFSLETHMPIRLVVPKSKFSTHETYLLSVAELHNFHCSSVLWRQGKVNEGQLGRRLIYSYRTFVWIIRTEHLRDKRIDVRIQLIWILINLTLKTWIELNCLRTESCGWLLWVWQWNSSYVWWSDSLGDCWIIGKKSVAQMVK
jgi:hypothetical protein